MESHQAFYQAVALCQDQNLNILDCNSDCLACISSDKNCLKCSDLSHYLKKLSG